MIMPASPGATPDVPADVVLQTGHWGPATVQVFSPTGFTLATGGQDRAVRVWDAGEGRQLHRLTGHAGTVCSLAFSSDGRLLASGSDDRTIRLWDPVAAKVLRIMEGHEGPVIALAFSRDGSQLLSGSGESREGVVASVRLWEVRTGRLVRTIESRPFGLTYVGFAPDGTGVVVARSEGDMEIRGTITTYDRETGRVLHIRQEILRAATSDGRVQAVQEGQWAAQSVRLEQDGGALSRITGNLGPVALSPGGGWIAYSVYPYDTAVVRRTAGGPPLGTVRGEAWSLEKLAVSAGGLRLSTGGAIWDVPGGRKVASLLAQSGAATVAFHPNGKILACGAGSGEGMLMLWDLPAEKRVSQLKLDQFVVGMAFSPDGRYLAAGSRALELWDVASKKLVREFRPPGDVVTSPAFSPDGKRLAANSRGIVTLWDPQTGGEVARFGSYDIMSMGGLSYSPDGHWLASSAGIGQAKLYDAATGRVLRSLTMPGSPGVFAFRPDGRILVAGSRSQARFKKAPGGGFLAELEAVAGQHAAIAAWELPGGRLLFEVPAEGWVSAIRFTGDGRRLVVASGRRQQSGSVRLLDAATGRVLATLKEPVDAEGGAAFSPDLGWLAAASTGPGGGVKLWKLKVPQ